MDAQTESREPQASWPQNGDLIDLRAGGEDQPADVQNDRDSDNLSLEAQIGEAASLNFFFLCFFIK